MREENDNADAVADKVNRRAAEIIFGDNGDDHLTAREVRDMLVSEFGEEAVELARRSMEGGE